jgi:hypothetical protein
MPFSSLIVSIPLPDSNPLAVRCRVMRCTRMHDGQFALAAQFVSVVDLPILHSDPSSRLR